LASLLNNGTPIIRLRNLTVAPTTAVGGQAVTIGVTITQKAPAGGYVVVLSNSNPALTLPATVTIPAKDISATVVVPTSTVSAITTGTITATFGDVSAWRSLTIRPITVDSLTLTPGTVKGGSDVSGR